MKTRNDIKRSGNVICDAPRRRACPARTSRAVSTFAQILVLGEQRQEDGRIGRVRIRAGRFLLRRGLQRLHGGADARPLEMRAPLPRAASCNREPGALTLVRAGGPRGGAPAGEVCESEGRRRRRRRMRRRRMMMMMMMMRTMRRE